MKGLILFVFAIVMLTTARGEEEEQLGPLMESAGLEPEEDYLECFRCDLGFWDACYTTETNCSHGEFCYTGRGRAADALDVKMQGCAKAAECGAETTLELTLELFLNKTIFVMTKECCNTPFCNSAHQIPLYTLWHLCVALIPTWHLAEALRG